MKLFNVLALVSILTISVGCKKQDEIDALNAQVKSLESQVSSQSTDIDSLSTEVTAHEQTITILSNSITSKDIQISELNSVIETLQGDAETNQAAILALETQVASLNGEISSLEQQLSIIGNQLSTANTSLTAAYTEISDAAGHIFDIGSTWTYLGVSTVNPQVILFEGAGGYNDIGAFDMTGISLTDLINNPAYQPWSTPDGNWYYGGSNVANADGTYNFSRNTVNGENTYEGWIFEETTSSIKDIEKATALRQKEKLNKVTNLLEMEYGFSESRAKEVTSVISNWKRLSKSREMTAEEANMFAMEVVGSDMASLEEAMVNSVLGDSSLLDELTNNAADLNGSSPEAISALINTLN